MTTNETRIKQRRELAQRLLESHEGHADSTIEGAFHDLLDAANRAVSSRDGNRTRVIPVGVLKVLIEEYGAETVTAMAGVANAVINNASDDPPPPTLRVVK